MNLFGLLLACCGLFAMAGSAGNWNWFFNHHKARIISSLIGRTGARVFYAVLGGGLAILGILIALGILSPSGAGV